MNAATNTDVQTAAPAAHANRQRKLHGPPRPARLLATLVTLVLILLTPATAWAHGDAGSTRAFDLVRQAIALIVNTPDDMAAIADKVNDALDSADPSEVRLPLVTKAKDTLAAGDLHQTRALLEQSIGARVHTSGADPVVIGQAPPPVTGEDTGTLATIEAVPGRHGLRGGDWVLLVTSLVVAVLGVGLSVRLRPHLLSPPASEVTS